MQQHSSARVQQLFVYISAVNYPNVWSEMDMDIKIVFISLGDSSDESVVHLIGPVYFGDQDADLVHNTEVRVDGERTKLVSLIEKVIQFILLVQDSLWGK